MKFIYHISLCIAALTAAAGCAKVASTGPNDAAKRYLEAWMHVNHPEIEPTGLGVYILEQTPGTSDITVTNNGCVFVEYISRNLDGTITACTDSLTARQLGQYSPSAYYGPQPWLTIDGTIQAGLQQVLVGMKVGGSVKVVVPSWLMSYSTFQTEAEYLAQSVDYSDAIYDITVRDYTDSIDVWQIDSIKRYITTNYGSVETFVNDTTGFYYKQLSAPVDNKAFSSDTTIYINYTGKLLNGLVFDTSIERTAKDHNIYDATRTYGPVDIKWGEKASDLKMGSSSSSMITGFARALWSMKAMEKGVSIFYSPLGYGYSGSGSSIPAYAPLVFEIEIVEAPEE